MDDPPLDVAALNRRTIGDRAVRDDLLRLFIEHAPAMLEAMTAALGREDAIAAAAMAHRLAGAAATVSAVRLADVIHQCESAVAAGKWDVAWIDCTQAHEELGRCVPAIEVLLKA